jgi:hypothetical protein
MRSNSKKNNLVVCKSCYVKDLRNENSVIYLLEVIFETSSCVKGPVLANTVMICESVLRRLEEKFIIMTTEFPKDEICDSVLIMPLGTFQIKKKGCFMCGE